MSSLADLRTDAGNRRLDEMRRRPVLLRSTDVDDEVAQQLDALASMRNLRMKLHAPHLLRLVRHRSHSIRGLRNDVKSRSHRFGVITVRHPDLEHLRQAMKQRRLGD